jgi:hypothetical protein
MLLLLAACHKDADEELRKAEQRSWRSTLELVASEEAKHNVPPVYVKQVREVAAKSLSKEREKANKAREAKK